MFPLPHKLLHAIPSLEGVNCSVDQITITTSCNTTRKVEKSALEEESFILMMKFQTKDLKKKI